MVRQPLSSATIEVYCCRCTRKRIYIIHLAPNVEQAVMDTAYATIMAGRNAEADGWIFTPGGALCPNCKGKE